MAGVAVCSLPMHRTLSGFAGKHATIVGTVLHCAAQHSTALQPHRLSACCRMCSAPSPAAGAEDAAVGPGPGGSAIGGDSSTSTALSARLRTMPGTIRTFSG